MPVLIENLVCKFAKEMEQLFGETLSRVIVYGSYARGDYTDDSDIDIMLLVKLSEEEIRKFRNDVSDCAFEYLIKYGIDLSPVIMNETHFNYWVDSVPYYRNVRDEGVIVNAG